VNVNELWAEVLQRTLDMVKATLADFSDQDMLTRPAPGANHAAWQLGHLTNSETNMINAFRPGAAPALPPGFSERFAKDKSAGDNPADFLTKAELLAAFEKVRMASIAWVKSLSPQDYDQPSPEKLRRFAATAGQLAAMIPVHTTMHVGQFQVIRRKLGKPVLF
jgi:hypothetical protein